MIRTLTFMLLIAALFQPVQASMIERRLSPAVSTLGTGALQVCVDTNNEPNAAGQSQEQRNILKELTSSSDSKDQ